jgi:hypothetical protein
MHFGTRVILIVPFSSDNSYNFLRIVGGFLVDLHSEMASLVWLRTSSRSIAITGPEEVGGEIVVSFASEAASGST